MKALTSAEFAQIVEEAVPATGGDLVGLWWIAKLVEDLTGTGNETTEPTLAVVKVILAKGVRAGSSPYDPEGWQPWPDQAPAVLDRIRDEWQARGHAPNIHDSPWFGW